jgi:hypothetical protein
LVIGDRIAVPRYASCLGYLLWLKAAIILYSESFFGDLHGQGHHAIEFFTQTKVVVERWRQNWSRQF